MNTDEYMRLRDTSHQILADLLAEKFGKEVMVQLLLDKMAVVPCDALSKGKFYRRRKEMGSPFGDPPLGPDPHGLHGQIKPHLVLQAIGEAAENMNYSNWIGEKLEIAEEVVFRYCEDHNISIEMVTVVEDET